MKRHRSLSGGGGVWAAVVAGCVVLVLYSRFQVPCTTPATQQSSSLWKRASWQPSGAKQGSGDGLDQPARGAADAAPPAPPPGVVGPRLQPWVHNRSCLVYIMDGSTELAPYADVPQCNISDPAVRSPLLLVGPYPHWRPFRRSS